MLKNGVPSRFAASPKGFSGMMSMALFLSFVLYSFAIIQVFTPVSAYDRVLEEAASLGGIDEEDVREDDYHRWGGIVSEVNPKLTKNQAYEIGKAVSIYSEAYDLSARLVMAMIIVESHGKVNAVSPKGAIGLMQVMPWWKEELCIMEDLFGIEANIKAGCHILANNISKWGYKEGIMRYYRGNRQSDERYFLKVQKALRSLSA